MKFLAALIALTAAVYVPSTYNDCMNTCMQEQHSPYPIGLVIICTKKCDSKKTMLMNLVAAQTAATVTPQEDFSFKDLKNAVNKGINKAKNSVKKMTKLDAAPAFKNLDQLVNDYGMEFEYSNIDLSRPMPYPGYAAASVYGAYGDYPYGPNPWDGDFYGAYAAPGFIY